MPSRGYFQLAGAWGFGPFQNDSALDWLGWQVQDPLAQAIEKRLKTKPRGSSDYDDIVAAAALLNDLTFRRTDKRTPVPPGSQKAWAPGGYATLGALHLNYQAEQRRLWSLALEALRPVTEDAQWITSWTSPDAKIQELEALLEDLASKQNQEDPR